MPKRLFSPDGYEIIKYLGSGGTASVYLAKNLSDNKLYALKAPLRDASSPLENFQTIIEREYRLIGKLGYPGLVRVHGINKNDSDFPYLFMEYCSQTTLANAEPIEAIPALINILSSMSINLYYLNLAGITHGDLKPDNIFLTKNIAEYSTTEIGFTKISDFSLALKSNETLADRLGVGTVGFMAPETIDGKAPDHRSDIFSLGIIAYKLTTGKHPFIEGDRDPVRINACIKEYTPPPPKDNNHSIPPALSEIIMSMLAKEADKRPRDGFELCRQLEQAGAAYPYREIIRPKHVLDIIDSDDTMEILHHGAFALDNPTFEKILDVSGNDKTALRHILEINFAFSNLQWIDGRLRVKADKELNIIWPNRLRKEIGCIFQNLKYSEKKAVIRCAIIGSIAKAQQLGILPTQHSGFLSRPLVYFAGQNIDMTRLHREALALARISGSQDGTEAITADLYLKAQSIDIGYNHIIDCVNCLLNKNEYAVSLALLRRLARQCRQNDDVKKLKIVLMMQADTEKMIGDTHDAEKTYDKIIKLYNALPPDGLLGETYKDLGDLYKIRQNFQAGIDALKMAESIYTELNDDLELSHTLNNIGNILVRDRQYDDAFANYRRALKIQRKLNSFADIASTLNNMSLIYMNRGRLHRVIRLFKLSLRYNQELGNGIEIARSLNNLGCTYHELGQFDDSMEHLKEASSINKRLGIKKELLFNLDNLSQVMLSSGRLKETLAYLREGIELARELSDQPHTAFMTLSMANTLKRMGYYGQAYEKTMEAIGLGEGISDENHPSACAITLADLFIRLNAGEKAETTTKEIFELGQKYKDRRTLLAAYTLSGVLKKDCIMIDKALLLADELKLQRRRTLINFEKLKVCSGQESNDFSPEIIDLLSDALTSDRPDIETANLFIVMANWYLKTGDRVKAKEHFNKGLNLATKMSLLPERIDASIGLGAIHADAGDYEKAFKFYRESMKWLKIMADDINNEFLKKSFLTDSRIKTMSDEIGNLQRILAEKSKAGR